MSSSGEDMGAGHSTVSEDESSAARLSVTERDVLRPVSLEQMPGPLDRERPVRKPLIPSAVRLGVPVTVGLLSLICLGVFMALSAARVTVPDLAGANLTQAKARCTELGLSVRVASKRFSDRPEGEVLAQSPRAGMRSKRGVVVQVVVSAGTEDLAMPDVVGETLVAAQALLENKGLSVVVEPLTSDATSGTVLGSTPAAGQEIRSGQVIRLMVAAKSSTSGALQPYTMTDLSVAIDVVGGASGVPSSVAEVAKRLQSLLEASGARVSILRTKGIGDPSAPGVLSGAGAALSVAVYADDSGPGGRRVSAPASTSSTSAASARFLATALVDSLTSQAGPCDPPSFAPFGAYGTLNLPWTAVRLGSLTDSADSVSLANPDWQDAVARALYRGIGEVFGRKEQR